MLNYDLMNKLKTISNVGKKFCATQFQFTENFQKILTKPELNWENALPYCKIPGPTKLQLIKGFLPGGKYYKTELLEFQSLFQNEYGNIIRMPGVFGKNDLIVTYDPVDFETIYRTEGATPVRHGLDAFVYYRKIKNPELFVKAGGLIAEQGEDWTKFRKIVNPVMLQTKNLKMYIPKLNEVGDQFVERIRLLRNSKTGEVPGTFERDINLWILASISVVALDTNLGLLQGVEKNPNALKLINAMALFFQLSYELDIKPSFWKIIKTPKFYKQMNNLNTITNIITGYIDERMAKLKANTVDDQEEKIEEEKSVLEKLLKVDRKIAIVMAMDLLFGGVDSSTSAFVACLLNLAKNPEKQKILYEELSNALPEKSSPITKENINNLPYLRACIKESLRLNPVTTGNLRTTGQDIVLQGYKIPKGTDMAMANVLVCRNEAYFSQGNEFLPERWLRTVTKSKDNYDDCKNSSKSSHSFAYLPFGFGPRSCIGKKLVSLETEIGLAKVFRNFLVEFNYPNQKVFKANVINVPNVELKFQFYEHKR